MLKVIVLLITAIVFSQASNDYKYDQDIHNAIRNNNVDAMKFLLSNSPEYLNEKDNYGYTPLHLAVRKGDIEIVKYLLSLKPDLNTQDKFGDTPLIDSARNNNIEISKILICSGAKQNIENNDNKIALDYISENKQYETALFFKKPECGGNNDDNKKELIEKLRKLQ